MHKNGANLYKKASFLIINIDPPTASLFAGGKYWWDLFNFIPNPINNIAPV